MDLRQTIYTNFIHWQSALVVCGTAVSMYIFAFSRNKEIPTAEPCLRKFCPGLRDTFYLWLDFIIVVGFGSILAEITFAPTNTRQAMAAGLGAFAVLNGAVGKLSGRRTRTKTAAKKGVKE